MKIYKMELAKILKRKSTWVLIGLLIGFIVIRFMMEISGAENMVGDCHKSAGYICFFDLAEIFIACASIGEILLLSSFYCEDRSNKVDVLLLTTAKGKLHDFIARVLVTFTIIISVHMIMILAALIIGSVCFGYPDNNLLMRDMYVIDPLVSDKSVLLFMGMYLFDIFNASIMLVSFIACISTMCKKTISSVIITVAVVLIPALLEGFFKNGHMNVGYTIITGQPLMLTARRVLVESWPVYGWHIFIAYFMSIIAIIIGGKKWCSVPIK